MKLACSLLLALISWNCFSQRPVRPAYMYGKWAMCFGMRYYSSADDGLDTDTTDCTGDYWSYEFFSDSTFIAEGDNTAEKGRWKLMNNMLVLLAANKQAEYPITYISSTRLEFPYTWKEPDGSVGLVYIHFRRVPSKK